MGEEGTREKEERKNYRDLEKKVEIERVLMKR